MGGAGGVFGGGRAGLHLCHPGRRAHALHAALGRAAASGARRSRIDPQPSELAVPREVIDKLPPRPSGYGFHRELFPRTTGSAFDVLTPAAIAADVTIGFVLEPDRAARVVNQHALDATLPGLEEVIDKLTKATFDGAAANPYEQAILRAAERVLVDRLLWLAGRAPNAQVRAVALLKLEKLRERLDVEASGDDAELAHRKLRATDIRRFIERPSEAIAPVYTSTAPPGAPIGGDVGMDWLAPVVWECVLQEARQPSCLAS